MTFEGKKTVEDANGPTPKRSLTQAIDQVKSLQGTADYLALTADLKATLKDWDAPNSVDIRQHYPGWDKQDFRTMLEELNEDEPVRQETRPAQRVRDQEERAYQAFRRERDTFETADLEKQLYTLKHDLMIMDIPGKEPLDLESDLAYAESAHARHKKQLDGMSWFQKLQNSKATKNVREDIDYQASRITDVKRMIAESPLEDRQKQIKAEQDKKQLKRQELIKRIETTTASLEKMKSRI